MGNLRRLGPREWGGYLNVRFETFKDACIKTYWRIFYRGMNRAPGENLRHASGFQYLAVESYDPEPTEVPVVLFRSQFLQTGLFRDPELGWGEIARGGLVVHEVPGNHRAIFDEPGVGLLADALIGHLKNQAPPSPSSFNGRGRVTS